MRPPPSLHSSFFSSLKQVERRLKSEQPPSQINTSSMDSLSSPIHFHLDRPNDGQTFPTLQESSELPQAFLSCSPQFPLTHEKSLLQEEDTPEPETNPIDDIDKLIQLLSLSDSKEEDEEEEEALGFGCGSCHCEGGFYAKIAGVRGPKCEKEVERLENWIKHFLNSNGEKIEPLRLSLLLLGKAAYDSQSHGEDSGFGGLEFPSAIEDFLMNDPPKAS